MSPKMTHSPFLSNLVYAAHWLAQNPEEQDQNHQKILKNDQFASTIIDKILYTIFLKS